MLTKLRLLFSITIFFLSFYAVAQGGYWEQKAARNSLTKKIAERYDVRKGMVFSFEEDRFQQVLKSVPSEGKGFGTVRFPDSEGRLMAYRVTESPVLSPELGKKYPRIKSYNGHGIDNPEDRVRFSVSPKGVQAMIVHADGRRNDFVQKMSGDTYVLFSRDVTNLADSDFVCRTEQKVIASDRNLTARPVDGQVLRKYRLAVAATAEYTKFHGGTVADALAAINATVTRINEVFETDLAVTLELVDDNDQVIFTDAATDPFAGNLGGLGDEAQNTLTDRIGEDAYDIGHVFHEGENGGNAGFIGAVCVDNRKGSAYSSSLRPEGDIFDLDFAAHEIGHQLGANHTWSFESEGTLVQVEPGSGTTIMGYAGITQNDDVQPNGDDYFHYISMEQIIDNLSTKSCGEIVPIANEPPQVDALESHIIPKLTAFVLTGSATDADTDDVLTYAWEQIDNGVVTRATFGPANPSGANFRSRPPTSEPSRYFPLLSRVVDGALIQEAPPTGSAWETVSSVEREMNFAFTVRDNAPGGGQVVSEFTDVMVTNRAGPFSVTSQAADNSFLAGTVQEIVWDVAATDEAPVNTKAVDILLSTDGGTTFPVVVAEGVPNDGSHEIVVPGLPTTEARFMVMAADNIFFAVNASDFAIEASEIVLDFATLEYEVCQGDDMTLPFTYERYLGFDEEVTFSVANAPGGLGISFSQETAITDDASIDILVENTENLEEGDYELLVTASSASLTKQVALQLAVFDTDFPVITPTAPADADSDISTRAPLTWEENPSYTSFEVQIAVDASFSNLTETADVFKNSYTPNALESGTTYFWRVKPLNACGEGVFNPPNSFTTIDFNCENKPGKGPPLDISAAGQPTVISKITFFEDLVVEDINVNLDIDHSFLSDLTISLKSPAGTTVILVSNSCGDQRNIKATFDDDAPDFVCGADGQNAITGTVRPLISLGSFDGESILGEWILEVQDNAPSDGGSLNGFSLDICVEGDFRPDADRDGVFDDGDDLCPGTPEGAEVDTSGCRIYRLPNDNFTVSVQSETCRNNGDGSITIGAELILELMYDITVTGNGTSISDSFVDMFTATDLAAGTYTVCIDGSSIEIDYEEYCFEVVVTEPEALDVVSQLSDDGTKVSISMEGADTYTIEFNGKTIRTEKSTLILDLVSGANDLKVSTDRSCQGIHEDRFVVSEGLAVFPNPFANVTRLFLGEVEEQLSIAIFSTDGQLIREYRQRVDGNLLDLDFTGLPPGVYVIKYKGKERSGTTKVIKR